MPLKNTVARQPLLLPWRFTCWQLLQSALTQGTYSHSDSQAKGSKLGHIESERDSNQCETYAHPLLAGLIQLYQNKCMAVLWSNDHIAGRDKREKFLPMAEPKFNLRNSMGL